MKTFFAILFLIVGHTAFSATDTILVLSDIHLKKLAIANTGTAPQDADTALFNSAMNSVPKNIKMVLIPGDIFWHSGNIDKTTQDMQSILGYITTRLKTTFPNAQIVPALGNNDFITHNRADTLSYQLFYDNILSPLDKDGTIRTSFLAGGYYSYKNAAGLTIISLNTILFDAPNAAADDELNWMGAMLAKSHDVWLMYHIPPGIDAYHKIKYDTAINMWGSQQYQQRFLDTIAKYQAKIKFQLAGHTHMDDYRTIKKHGKLVSYIHIAPGLSTRNGNDPGYQLLCYDTREHSVKNIITYFKDPAADWKIEYDFQSTYHTSLNSTKFKMPASKSKMDLYKKYYSISHPVPYSDSRYWDGYLKAGALNIH